MHFNNIAVTVFYLYIFIFYQILFSCFTIIFIFKCKKKYFYPHENALTVCQIILSFVIKTYCFAVNKLLSIYATTIKPTLYTNPHFELLNDTVNLFLCITNDIDFILNLIYFLKFPKWQNHWFQILLDNLFSINR